MTSNLQLYTTCLIINSFTRKTLYFGFSMLATLHIRFQAIMVPPRWAN